MKILFAAVLVFSTSAYATSAQDSQKGDFNDYSPDSEQFETDNTLEACVKTGLPIGSVVSSALPPKAFNFYTEGVWLRANGQPVEFGTCFSRILRKLEVPNLNGQFIRGMAAGLKVGTNYDEQVGEHDHDHIHSGVISSAELKAGDGKTYRHLKSLATAVGLSKWDATGNNEIKVTSEAVPTGQLKRDPGSEAAENRPENVPLFFYIRID